MPQHSNAHDGPADVTVSSEHVELPRHKISQLPPHLIVLPLHELSQAQSIVQLVAAEQSSVGPQAPQMILHGIPGGQNAGLPVGLIVHTPATQEPACAAQMLESHAPLLPLPPSDPSASTPLAEPESPSCMAGLPGPPSRWTGRSSSPRS